MQSDNTATNLLLFAISPQSIADVFQSLDFPSISENEAQTYVSVKNYSSIFRSLYLSSYLSRQSSNEILNILTQTIFNDKIAALPTKDIKVAHKIGVLNSVNSNETIYTDCGIVYVPNRPYILCVFAKESEEKAGEHMRFISNLAYSYMIAVK